MHYASTRDNIRLVHLDIMITPKCTLKCKYCSNLMQYYPEELQKHFDIAKIIHGIDILMSMVNRIDEVFIIGGEPFVHPDLSEVITAVAKYKSKIGYACIASNGVVEPSESAVAALRETQTPVRVTLYKPFVDKQVKRCSELLDAGVEVGLYHRMWTMTTQCIDGTPETFYKYCHHMVMPCVTLKGDSLYYCEFTANADALGCPCEHIDLSSEVTRGELYDYLNPQVPFNACQYCSGGSSDICIEAGATQLNAPAIFDWTGGCTE